MLPSGSNADRVAAFQFDAALRRAGALCSKATYTMREKEYTPDGSTSCLIDTQEKAAMALKRRK